MEPTAVKTTTTKVTNPNAVQTEEVQTVKTAVPAVPVHPKGYHQKKQIFVLNNIIWYIFSIFEVLLLFRFIFQILGGNASAPFVSLINTITNPFVYPFNNIFPIPEETGIIFEWGTLLAMVVYYLILLAIMKLIFMSKPVTPAEVEKKLAEEEP